MSMKWSSPLEFLLDREKKGQKHFYTCAYKMSVEKKINKNNESLLFFSLHSTVNNNICIYDILAKKCVNKIR